jgi:excisionase family DNA binding protein
MKEEIRAGCGEREQMWCRLQSAPHRAAWPVREGAHRLGVGRSTIYKLAAEGKLRLVKVAGRTLIPDSEIVRLVNGGQE